MMWSVRKNVKGQGITNDCFFFILKKKDAAKKRFNISANVTAVRGFIIKVIISF